MKLIINIIKTILLLLLFIYLLFYLWLFHKITSKDSYYKNKSILVKLRDTFIYSFYFIVGTIAIISSKKDVKLNDFIKFKNR